MQHTAMLDESDSQTRQHTSSTDCTALLWSKLACAIQKIEGQQALTAEKNTTEMSWTKRQSNRRAETLSSVIHAQSDDMILG